MLSTDEELNEQILQEMRQAGDDLSAVRSVCFQFAFPSRESARSFAADLGSRGLLADVDDHGDGPVEDLPWDVDVAIKMRPELASITGYERDLGEIAATYHGRGDGWFCERIVRRDT